MSTNYKRATFPSTVDSLRKKFDNLLTSRIKWTLVTFWADHMSPSGRLLCSKSSSVGRRWMKLPSFRKFWLDTLCFSRFNSSSRQSSTIIPTAYRNKHHSNSGKGRTAPDFYSSGGSMNLQLQVLTGVRTQISPSPGDQGPPSNTMCHWTQ